MYYVYIYTQVHVYISEKYVMFIYEIYLFIIQLYEHKYKHVNA